MHTQPNRRDYVTCDNCARPHKLQRKDLAAHLSSLESKGERKRQPRQMEEVTAPLDDRKAVARLRGLRLQYAHVPAEHMPDEVRKVLGV